MMNGQKKTATHQGLQLLDIGGDSLIVVLLPRLDLDVVLFQGGEGFDESLCQTYVGHQRNVMVDGTTTDAVAVG